MIQNNVVNVCIIFYYSQTRVFIYSRCLFLFLTLIQSVVFVMYSIAEGATRKEKGSTSENSGR